MSLILTTRKDQWRGDLMLTFGIEGRGFESRWWYFLGRFVTSAQIAVADPGGKGLSHEFVSLAMGPLVR